MREQLEYWLEGLRLNWQHLHWLVPHIRGVTRDHTGKRYWRVVRKASYGGFTISLICWPGLTYARESAGFIALGSWKADNLASWMIFDVRVPSRRQQRGLGTALVLAGIDLARRCGARELRGSVIPGDAPGHPFLPDWYARLGFTVQPYQEERGADFWMRLKQS